jgi:hypothetical protein
VQKSGPHVSEQRDTGLRERDAMICRSCGHEERASEGYPCKDCGTFICIMCVFKGVIRCERCAAIEAGAAAASGTPGAAAPSGSGTTGAASSPGPGSTLELDWPEH